MEKTYDELIDLINAWKAFKEKNAEGGLADFSHWLGASEKKENRFGETEKFIVRRTNELEESKKQAAMIANRAIIGSLLGRLNHFVKNYTKIPFRELGLNSMDDFKILSLIERMKKPNKSNLAQTALMEFSTINDMLKRFKENGWIKTEKDETDRRASIVLLTENGSQTLHRIYKTLSGIQPSLTGDLTEEEQQQLTKLLMRLNHFHTHYYENHFIKKK